MKLKNIIGNKIAVHCKTEDEAKRFITMCKDEELLWSSGKKLHTFNTHWDIYGDDTYYAYPVDGLQYGDSSYFRHNNYYLISFSEIEGKRKEKNMTTLEMLNAAKETNDVYISGGMLYSNGKGFHELNGKEWEGRSFRTVNAIFELDDWRLFPKREMTLEEIELQLGCSIKLIQ